MNQAPAKDNARYWIDRDLGGLECLSATYVGHRFAPHVHEEFVIGVIQAGAQGGPRVMGCFRPGYRLRAGEDRSWVEKVANLLYRISGTAFTMHAVLQPKPTA